MSRLGITAAGGLDIRGPLRRKASAASDDQPRAPNSEHYPAINSLAHDCLHDLLRAASGKLSQATDDRRLFLGETLEITVVEGLFVDPRRVNRAEAPGRARGHRARRAL